MKYTLIFSFILASVWPISDFLSRFTPSISKENKALIIATPETLTSLRLLKEQTESLDAAYAKYKPVTKTETKATEVKVETTPEINQLAQNGFLDEVLSGDHKLILKAIIVDENLRSALIEVTNTKTNEVELQKFQSEQDVFGYKLIIESNTQIQLSNSSTKQRIILSMYKRQTKNTKLVNTHLKSKEVNNA